MIEAINRIYSARYVMTLGGRRGTGGPALLYIYVVWVSKQRL